MKVLWLVNITLPEISLEIGESPIPFGGWLDSLLSDISEKIDITICYPTRKKKESSGKINRYSYTSYYQVSNRQYKFGKKQEAIFAAILDRFTPDIVHIWGTETEKTLFMINACIKKGLINRTILSIQGISALIAQHYTSGLPCSHLHKVTFRDFFRNDSIIQQKRKYQKRGQYEIQALKKIKYVIGRTDWDLAYSTQINSSISYFKCNESIRMSFYEKQWSIDNCVKRTLFMSQGNYPIKGLHYMLEAITILKNNGYNNILLNIAGSDVTRQSEGVIGLLKKTYYGTYISKLIKKNSLKKNVCFLGVLSEDEICHKLIKSNIFVSSSIIENESNSLSEAKLMGVPCIASYVGGITNRITHNFSGFLYQHDAPYMLAYYIKQILDNDKTAIRFSINAIKEANVTNNREENAKIMHEIYNQIVTGEIKTH